MRANTKYIKQCVAMSLILSSVLLSGCANKIDEVSQKMMDDINAIGTVEISDEETIEKAEKLYGTLTDKQKEQVNNYADLLNARDELDKLLEEKAKKDAEEADRLAEEERKAEEEKAEKERQEKLASYTPEVKYCARAIITVKRALKNPDSMVVHSFYYGKTDNGESVNLDVTSENGFGGSNRDTLFVTDNVDKWGLEIVTTETGMGVMKDNTIVDSEMTRLLDEYDGVDNATVLQLVDEYEETKDISLIY